MPLRPTKRPYVDIEVQERLFSNGGSYVEQKATRRFFLDLVGATPENFTNYLSKPGWRVIAVGNLLNEKGETRGAEIEGIAKICNLSLNAEARAQAMIAAASANESSIKTKLEKKLSEKSDA